MIKLNLIIVMLFAAANLLFAGSRDTLTIKNNDINIRALKLDEPILLDGKLDESIWQRAEKYDNFIQRDPEEGKPASQRTVVKVAYDESALYVAAVMFDEPDSIISRLSRRDEFVQTDRFTLFLDPYYDKRSGYYFSVTAAGSLIDGVLFNDGWDDNSWDGVWEAKVSHN
ncbi:MAG TPA: carbohydrate binding family 9 domain-containing protein, partial [Ignavibacteriaceae bacterium]|nr:carbohydrate binding family 9 domain-containing protein [Ignavibacteriaceae bacterium]